MVDRVSARWGQGRVTGDDLSPKEWEQQWLWAGDGEVAEAIFSYVRLPFANGYRGQIVWSPGLERYAVQVVFEC